MDLTAAERCYQLHGGEYNRLKQLDERREKRIKGTTAAFKAVALSLLLSVVPPVSGDSQEQDTCFESELRIDEVDENGISSKLCLEPIINPVAYTFDIPGDISIHEKERYLAAWYSEYLEFETPEYQQEALVHDTEHFPDIFFHQANGLISQGNFDTLYFQLLVDIYFFAPMYRELSEQEKIEFIALKEELYSYVPNIGILPSPEGVKL